MESMQPETDKNGEMQGSKEDLRKMFDIPENSGMETMIVAKIMTNAENEEILIIADSVITPVTATVPCHPHPAAVYIRHYDCIITDYGDSDFFPYFKTNYSY